MSWIRPPKASLPLLIGFGACLWLSFLDARSDLLRQFRDVAWENALRLRGPRPPPDSLAVVAVTQEDLATLGKWPWPRSMSAGLFRRLAAAPPRVLVPMFTYVMATRPKAHLLMQAVRRYPMLAIEESGLEAFVESLSVPFEDKVEQWLAAREPVVRERAPVSLPEFARQRVAFLDEIRAVDADPDSIELVRSLEGVPTCLQNIGQLVDTGVLDEMGLEPRGAAPESMPFARLRVEGTWTPEALRAVSRIEPKHSNFPQLTRVATCQGMFVARGPAFSVLWREPMVLRVADQVVSSLALAAVARFRGLPPVVRIRESGIEVWLGDERLPLDDGGGLWINYFGKGMPFRSVSSVRLLEIGAPELADKLVFFAQTTARHAYFPSVLPSPYGGTLSQSELAITAAAALLDGSGLHHHGGTGSLLLFGLPWAVLQFLLRRRLWLVVGLGVAGVASALALAYGLFLLRHLIDPVVLVIWLVLATGITLAVSFLEQRAGRKAVERAFGFYLSPQVAAEVLRNPDTLRPGGQRREISVLFSDIRNFTALSEHRDPALVARILNLYFDAMARCVVKNGGVIDKFIGDGLLAYFGAPLAQPDHALRAVHTAQDMRVSLVEVRRAWQALGVLDLRIGIGVHTGPALVGNLGSEERLDFTVIGDTVNTASRIEAATKTLGVDLLLTDATRGRLPPDLPCRSMGTIQVKGRESAIEVFTPGS